MHWHATSGRTSTRSLRKQERERWLRQAVVRPQAKPAEPPAPAAQDQAKQKG